MSRRPSSAAARFGRHEGGAVAVLFALAAFVICGIVGLAFDGMRAYRMKSRVTAVIDAAALAGAKLLNNRNATNSEVEAAVTAVITAANQDFAGLWASLGQPVITVDRSTNTVAIAINVAVPTLVSRVVGISNLDFASNTKVAYRIQALELAMVLDVTGSMNDAGKLAALKTSAGAVIDTLMATARNDDTVRIGLAPFSAAVNTGSFNSRISGNPASMDKCVVERLGSEQLTDAPPTGTDAMRWFDPATTGGSRYTCPDAEIVPLTQNVMHLKDTIAAYNASGWTAGHIGAAWGWYLLSPNWGSIWPRSPAPYTDPSTVKSLIFLTDGIFNASYLGGLATPGDQQVTESYAQFAALCTAIKAQNITIYTIALDLTDTTARTALRNCASSSSRAFESPTASQLEGVFMQIVQDLSVLRLVE